MKHQLEAALAPLIGAARLKATLLPELPLQLWLLDPEGMQRAFNSEETQRILEQPPYWCFCWASGLALAQWLLENAQQVQGLRVLDVGSGSGIAALAAAYAGAREVVACDLDPIALQACAANAQLNALPLHYSDDFFKETQEYDLILAADLLYDPENRGLLEHFQYKAKRVLIADSRVRDLKHPTYQVLQKRTACTLPDLGEPDEYRQVTLYQALSI